MKRIFQVAAALLAALFLTMGAWAFTPQNSIRYSSDDYGKNLIPIDSEDIEITGSGIRIRSDDVAVGDVETVTFVRDELDPQEDYTVRKKDGVLTVNFKKSFLEQKKPGTYTVWIVCKKHSVLVDFVLEDKDGYYTAEPPRTKKPSGGTA